MGVSAARNEPQWLALLPFVALVAAVAYFGAQFEPGDWYGQLVKPSWTPPSWLFGPVWTLLYIAIAIAGWLAWRERAAGALSLWALQLALNAAWSWLFFGLHRIELALLDIVVLLATIIAFVIMAWPRQRAAAWLFVPYALWVGYATALNAAIASMNP